MNAVLIGMKHSGKSTLGAALAARWQCPFHDVDRLIESTYECDAQERLTVRELLTHHGDRRFREVEGQVVCELYLRLCGSERRNVISLGGRTALNEAVSQLLPDIGTLVYLDVPAEELFARIERRGLPPFLQGEDPFGQFLALCRERQPHFERLAELVVRLAGTDEQEATALISDRLEEHWNARE